MQVTETLNQGLKREFQVVVPAAELDAKVNQQLDQLKDRVRINGFRPGKVPAAHLKRMYGRSAMAEAIEGAVREANAQIVSDGGFKLAMEPKVTLPNESGAVEEVISGQADLSYTVALEILPAIELGDFKSINLERLVSDIDESEIDQAVKNIAEQNKPFSTKPDGAKAENGDRVTLDFTGKIDGQPFEGGTGGDVSVLLGSGTFIPGFEEQLIGVGAGETRTVKVSFPENYMATNLAGKEAEFEVTAKSLEAPGTVTIDDEFAKTLGMESLEKLRDAVRDRVQREHTSASRRRIKRALLDQLDKQHQFTPPESLVEQEFEGIWRQIKGDLESQRRTFEDEGTTEDKAREEYRGIAERRVRLGLVLAEIGERNNIKVSDEELTRAIVERARQYPGREQEIWNHFRNSPDALATLRAPIYEEKVVDFLLELANVTEKKVSREDLYKEDEVDTAAAS